MSVIKGIRPPIDINKILDTSCDNRKIQIKIRPHMESTFHRGRHRRDRNGYVQTGNSNIDAAFRRIRGKGCRHIIDTLYQHSTKSNHFIERHREWGFHLWEQIELETGASFLEAIKHLSSLSEIEIAEPIYNKKMHNVFIPNDEWWGLQWALKNTGQLDVEEEYGGQYGIAGWDIGIENAWSIETGKPKVIVAVIDGGIDFVHPDIASNMWTGIGPQGINTVKDEHGTHVAGVIAAMTNNTVGMSGIAGGSGSGGVQLMSIDLWGEHGLTDLELFMYAADNGASISQNSWGYTEPNVYNQSSLDGIDYFNVYGGGKSLAGGLTIFAAGNSGTEEHWYPACYKHDSPTEIGVIAVAAHDNRGVKASFSNYGDWVDITAPGVNILSLIPDNQGAWLSGTSMACPHVSGVAALILSYLFPKITNIQLRDILLNNTRDIYSTNPTFTGKLGSGALSATQALNAAKSYQQNALACYQIGDKKYCMVSGNRLPVFRT